ncbi:MAG: hypothetical protein ACT4O2_02280 [Beijerinckiaceae bacterium]
MRFHAALHPRKSAEANNHHMGAACAIGVRGRIRIWLVILQKLARILQKLARPPPVKLIQFLDPLAR